MNDIIIITEIAELGVEASQLPDEIDKKKLNTKELVDLNVKKRGQLSHVRWSSVRFMTAERKRNDSEVSTDVSEEAEDSANETTDTDPRKQFATSKEEGSPAPQSLLARTAFSSSRSDLGLIRIKNLIDRWEEPVNKLDKVSCIHPQP